MNNNKKNIGLTSYTQKIINIQINKWINNQKKTKKKQTLTQPHFDPLAADIEEKFKTRETHHFVFMRLILLHWWHPKMQWVLGSLWCSFWLKNNFVWWAILIKFTKFMNGHRKSFPEPLINHMPRVVIYADFLYMHTCS